MHLGPHCIDRLVRSVAVGRGEEDEVGPVDATDIPERLAPETGLTLQIVGAYDDRPDLQHAASLSRDNDRARPADPASRLECETDPMTEPTTELMRLAGGDPFESVREASETHQREHGCGLHTAGPEVMQLAASYVLANNARSILDLGCGLGYSTMWLARAAGEDGLVIGIDSDDSHVAGARRYAEEAGLGSTTRFIVGDVTEVLSTLSGPFDAIHDDAWFGPAPRHLETMISHLRTGGVLTMPNWFLLVDAITGRPRNDWEAYAGPAWAADARAYAEQLAGRRDLSVNWITDPPLGVAVKR